MLDIYATLYSFITESYREELLEWQARTMTIGYIEDWDQLPIAKENFQV